MRHRKKSEKLSRSRAQKKALVKSLVRAVLIDERIKTTTSRAKYLRGEVDRLITKGKNDTLSSRRLVYRKLGDHKLVKRLFEVIAPRFKSINGGYTRTAHLISRKGDGASMSLLELTKREVKKKVLKGKKAKDNAIDVDNQEEALALKKPEKKKGIISGVKKIFKKERDLLK
ncbi:MAG: 50S ribosomal protein L17 [Candidatus Omnitrophica bacterium]|nr:50S ribosomal protein L17 [Candidatus Omnitrophota bacterium]